MLAYTQLLQHSETQQMKKKEKRKLSLHLLFEKKK
jgi:hypothetical protein